MPKLAIIGDGYSAAVLVYHLIKRQFNPQDITVFGPNTLGLGQAYGSQHQDYRLNVRDNLMRIDPEKPDDFVSWANEHIDDPDAEVEAGRFYRRSDFARYMQQVIHDITHDAPLHHIRETVDAITRDHDWIIETKTGQYRADLVVMATGNPASVLNFDCDDTIQAHITSQPWRGDWARDIAEDDDLVIIGGGLTAMDLLSSLSASHHKGHISVITPKGILPPPQLNWRDKGDNSFQWPDVSSASGLVRVMKTKMGASGWMDRDTQEHFEQLRKAINPVWRGLDEQHQTRLKRHLGWVWQLLRYRAAPQAVAAQESLVEKGQLSLIKGRVCAITPSSNSGGSHRITAHLDTGESIHADHGFIATGAGRDRLLAAMGASGLAQLKQGHLEVTERLQIIRPDGSIHHDAFALGPPTVMSRGDVIGATTIAGEAALIAETIMDHIKDTDIG